MVDIPEDKVTTADLAEWYQLKAELGKLKSKEALLRGRIVRAFFPNPVEGTNNHDMNDGTGAVMKLGYTIDRKVDMGALDALRAAQAVEGSNVPKVNLDELIKFKPELVISKYRELTAEEQNFVDQALIIKPGSPQLEIVIPKRVKA